MATFVGDRDELDVGPSLRRARETAGLTQAELARRLGTTQSAVSRAESGGAVSLEYLRRTARALGRPLTITVSPATPPDPEEAARRWALVSGGGSFDPSARNPAPVERRMLRRRPPG